MACVIDAISDMQLDPDLLVGGAAWPRAHSRTVPTCPHRRARAHPCVTPPAPGRARPQWSAVGTLTQQLCAVDVDDLPALVRFLAASATKATAPELAGTLRGALHCAAPSDPRLAVADGKQKGPAGGRGRGVPEARVLRELAGALQGCDAACGGFLKATGDLAGGVRASALRGSRPCCVRSRQVWQPTLQQVLSAG